MAAIAQSASLMPTVYRKPFGSLSIRQRVTVRLRTGHVKSPLLRWLLLCSLISLTGCDIATDAATRLAYDIEAGAGRLGKGDGARYSIQHNTPSKAGQCIGPYKVQLDKVGALIIWCKDATGGTVSSHSTSYHARFVDTPRTYLIEKPAGATLTLKPASL
jgi:hypothetical protein